MRKITIFSGKLHSGKTSAIIDISLRFKLYGFATPVLKGSRYLLNLATMEKRRLEYLKSPYVSDALLVGNFAFKPEVFEWARNSLLKYVRNCLSPIIIDEYGYLELQGKGFEPFLTYKQVRESNLKIIIVVREKLVQKLIETFSIDSPNIIYNLNELRQQIE